MSVTGNECERLDGDLLEIVALLDLFEIEFELKFLVDIPELSRPQPVLSLGGGDWEKICK